MQPTTYTYHIPTSKVCELAHQLLTEDLKNKGMDILNLEIDEEDKNGEMNYKPYYQAIFDNYVSMIENILLNEEYEEVDTNLWRLGDNDLNVINHKDDLIIK